METKKCSKCGEVKGLEEFSKRKDSSDGYRSYCKKCEREKTLIYRKENEDIIKEKKKIYALTNKDKLKQYKKTYYKKNKQRINRLNIENYYANREARIQAQKDYYKRTIDYRKVQLKKYYNKNRIEMIRRSKNWAKTNKHKRNESLKKYYSSNIQAKLARTLRNRLTSIMGNKKSHSTLTLLGCSLKYFKKHLEDQFMEGMTWDNHTLYGWHIDHKRPCASFDLTDPEQQKQCFHYTNLQPLWAKDNLSKGAKYII